MAKNTAYRLPDYTTLVYTIEEYCDAWQALAAPIEKAMGLTLSGFDPDFSFTKGNPNGVSVNIQLPMWFVKDLNKTIGAQPQ